jgi:hypothetical protein
MACVYRHIRLDKNQPFYIGIGKNINRAYQKRSRSKHWHNIANIGYEVEILFDDITWEDACKKEIEFIELYGRVIDKSGILVNITKGGEGTLGYDNGNHFWEGKSIYPHMKEAIIKSAKSRTKEKNAFYGKSHSNDSKSKISSANKGKLVGGKNPNATSVINTNTMVIYNSIADAARETGVSYSLIKSQCANRSRNPIKKEWQKIK